MDRQSFTDRVEALFKARPDTWVDAIELERIGGRQAWRTRVSQCRRERGMVIENKQMKQRDPQGRVWTTSLYRWVSQPQDAVEARLLGAIDAFCESVALQKGR